MNINLEYAENISEHTVNSMADSAYKKAWDGLGHNYEHSNFKTRF